MLKLTWIAYRLLYLNLPLPLYVAVVRYLREYLGTWSHRQCRKNGRLGHAATEEEITSLVCISVSVANTNGVVVVGVPVWSPNTFVERHLRVYRSYHARRSITIITL